MIDIREVRIAIQSATADIQWIQIHRSMVYTSDNNVMLAILMLINIFDINFNYSFSSYIITEVINIKTTLGKGMVPAGSLFPDEYFSIDVNDITLVKAILTALSNSRISSLVEWEVFFNFAKDKKIMKIGKILRLKIIN